MGDSGAYEIVSSDGVIYHANPYYEDISMEQVVDVCPFISDSQLDYSLDEPRGWKRFNMGYGNYLFIRDSIIEQFQLWMNTEKISKRVFGTYAIRFLCRQNIRIRWIFFE